ncbi:MAG: AAA family ATPase [Minisyncoccales bacterium]
MIIGVTGNNGSGKDTFAQYIVSNKGFIHISLSDFIREETARQGLELARHNLHDVGNRMREIFGPGILAKLALDRMDESKNYVVTSIRNPNEIKELKKAGNFILMAVNAPVETRFKRIIDRNRENEKEIISFEEFKKFEADELESQLSSSQQIKECIEMANFTVDNDCDIAAFPERIESVYIEIQNYLRKGK